MSISERVLSARRFYIKSNRVWVQQYSPPSPNHVLINKSIKLFLVFFSWTLTHNCTWLWCKLLFSWRVRLAPLSVTLWTRTCTTWIWRGLGTTMARFLFISSAPRYASTCNYTPWSRVTPMERKAMQFCLHTQWRYSLNRQEAKAMMIIAKIAAEVHPSRVSHSV